MPGLKRNLQEIVGRVGSTNALVSFTNSQRFPAIRWRISSPFFFGVTPGAAVAAARFASRARTDSVEVFTPPRKAKDGFWQSVSKPFN
jgi:hypothetical protein